MMSLIMLLAQIGSSINLAAWTQDFDEAREQDTKCILELMSEEFRNLGNRISNLGNRMTSEVMHIGSKLKPVDHVCRTSIICV
jgi:hypothetical protein